MGWAGKRYGDWTTLCHSCLKYAQYLRLYRLGRLSRGRLHNRPYNLHQGIHVTQRKKCALYFPRNPNLRLGPLLPCVVAPFVECVAERPPRSVIGYSTPVDYVTFSRVTA